NWFMIRQAAPQYSNYTSEQWNAGAALNSNLSWDVKVLKAAQSKWGIDLWFAGHRDGESGFQNPNTTDIQNYRNAVYWIKAQIDSNCVYRTDDTRFWVSVPAI
ncbi:hypothetical protein BGZ58_010349, partial [Dissophora ornata]